MSSSPLPVIASAAHRRTALARPLFAVLGVAFPLLFVSQLLISCGSDNKSSKVCNPGDSKACIGTPGQCAGSQTCNDSGSGYDTCACGGTATGNGGGGGTGGASSTGGTSSAATAGSGGAAAAPLSGAVGLPCASDADCPGAPLVCLLSSSNAEFGGGGPQGGYCSFPCTGTAECAAVDSASACGLIDPNTGSGYCVGLCVPGTSQVKCNEAQACYQNPSNPAFGVCFPVCTNDAACGPGRFCDPGGLGLCLDAAPQGAAVGAVCAAGADCASQICLQLTDGTAAANIVASFCSANCTFGVATACGYDPNGSAPRESACLVPQFAGGQPGDLGYCIPLCDTDADCAQQANGWTCSLFSAANAAAVGRAGECVGPEVGADAGPG